MKRLVQCVLREELSSARDERLLEEATGEAIKMLGEDPDNWHKIRLQNPEVFSDHQRRTIGLIAR